MKIDNITISDLNDLKALYDSLISTKADLKSMELLFEDISNDRNYYLLAVRDDGNKIIGTLSGIVCKDISGNCTPFMVLENIIVREDMRNKGIGKMLVNFIENVARERSCRYIIFVSAVKRIESHKFYESLGYELDKVRGFKKYVM